VLRHWVVVTKDKSVAFGDMEFIFNGNKIITTSGGGAIVAPTKALKKTSYFMPHSPEIMHLITSTVK
jgi:dTDP-4-amino-4,6-dideoxygalactose transaminase